MAKSLPVITVVAFLCAAGLGVVSYADPNADGKDFASQMNRELVNINPDSIDLSEVPHFAGEEVPQRDLYHQGAAIEDEARSQAVTDDSAVYIMKGISERPSISIDRQSDPLFMHHETITNRSVSLSDTYAGCVDLPVGQEMHDVTTTEQCDIHGDVRTDSFTCKRTISATCAVRERPLRLADFQVLGDGGLIGYQPNAHTLRFATGDNARSGNCRIFTNRIRFYVENLEEYTQFTSNYRRWDDSMHMSVNGTVVFSAGGGEIRTNGSKVDHSYTVTRRNPISGQIVRYPSCEYSKNWEDSRSVNLGPHLKVGWNEIVLEHIVGDKGNIDVRFIARRSATCDPTFKTTTTCPAGANRTEARELGSQCVDGPRTKQIDGYPVHRNCWEWEDSYESDYVIPIKSPECMALEERSCGQISSVCAIHDGRFCLLSRASYSCTNTEAVRHVSLCGEQLICEDGDCTSDLLVHEDGTDGFRQAASAMAIADEIADQFDHDELILFKGTDGKCRDDSISFAKCCKASGWSSDVGLDTCSTAEKELGYKRESGAAIYVGSYTSGSWYEVQRRYRVYCMYASKLARIFIEQGFAQQGRGFGTPRDPVCGGFLPEDFDTLDLDAMDFSELYGDMDAKGADGDIPSPGMVADMLRAKFGAMAGGSP